MRQLKFIQNIHETSALLTAYQWSYPVELTNAVKADISILIHHLSQFASISHKSLETRQLSLSGQSQVMNPKNNRQEQHGQRTGRVQLLI